MFKFCLVIFSMFCITDFSAAVKKDSLLVSISKPNAVDTSIINSYCSLVFIYLNEGNSDSGFICAKKAISLSEKLNYKKGIGMSYNALGRCYFERADYKTSIENGYNFLV